MISIGDRVFVTIGDKRYLGFVLDIDREKMTPIYVRIFNHGKTSSDGATYNGPADINKWFQEESLTLYDGER